MTAKLRKYWESFRSSFWFVPTIMAASSAALAFATISVDRGLSESWRGNGWVYTGGPEGARAVLSVIASSMITVAGTVFSITIVTLTLASSQFGPRLLRNFMRDAANQVVLGTFIATFLFCLLVLRTVRGVDDREFVPHVSVSVGVLLGLASLGVLIYFIHHVAVSIQASHILQGVSEDLHSAIDRLFPEELGDDRGERTHQCDQEITQASIERNGREFSASRSGYVQAIDNDRLMELAREHDLVIGISYRPGRFVVENSCIGVASPVARVTDSIVSSLEGTFIISRERTSTQDVEFVVSQLVEVALRALSPGINDPFTAISCIDWLATGLSKLASRSLPSDKRFDSDGRLRVIADSVTFARVADMAFNQIRQAAVSHLAVSIRILEAIGLIAARARRAADIVSLRNHAQLIWEGARKELLQDADRVDLERAFIRVEHLLNERLPR